MIPVLAYFMPSLSTKEIFFHLIILKNPSPLFICLLLCIFAVWFSLLVLLFFWEINFFSSNNSVYIILLLSAQTCFWLQLNILAWYFISGIYFCFYNLNLLFILQSFGAIHLFLYVPAWVCNLCLYLLLFFYFPRNCKIFYLTLLLCFSSLVTSQLLAIMLYCSFNWLWCKMHKDSIYSYSFRLQNDVKTHLKNINNSDTTKNIIYCIRQ